jgi:hypothetical protein
MIQPITLTQVGQMMVEDYRLDPDAAFIEARKLMERLERRGLQVIRGEWVQPEVVIVHDSKPQPQTEDDRWMTLASKVTRDTVGREPWKAPELR